MNHTTTANDPGRDVPAAGALPGVRDRADPRLVLADRVEQLYGQMWLGILTTFAIGAIATFEFWELRLRELVLFWWGAGVFLTLVLAGAVYRRLTTKLIWQCTKDTVHVTVMIFAITSHNLWFLNYVHVMAGLLWTGIDLFTDMLARGKEHKDKTGESLWVSRTNGR